MGQRPIVGSEGLPALGDSPQTRSTTRELSELRPSRVRAGRGGLSVAK